MSLQTVIEKLTSPETMTGVSKFMECLTPVMEQIRRDGAPAFLVGLDASLKPKEPKEEDLEESLVGKEESEDPDSGLTSNPEPDLVTSLAPLTQMIFGMIGSFTNSVIPEQDPRFKEFMEQQGPQLIGDLFKGIQMPTDMSGAMKCQTQFLSRMYGLSEEQTEDMNSALQEVSQAVTGSLNPE